MTATTMESLIDTAASKRLFTDSYFDYGGSANADDEETLCSPFNITGTTNVPIDRLHRWRQAARVLNASRRFRYTLDLKRENEKEQLRRKIRAHAQVIQAAFLFKAAGEQVNDSGSHAKVGAEGYLSSGASPSHDDCYYHGICDSGNHIKVGAGARSHRQSSSVSPSHDGCYYHVTGDRTNDAPVLLKADIGLAMGIAGTEVANESADVIIMDDNFSTFVTVAKWGRSAYTRIQKSAQFHLTLTAAALIVNFFSACFTGIAPLTADQVCWVPMIPSILAVLAFSVEPLTDDLMKKSPVGRQGNFISYKRYMLWQSSNRLFAKAAFSSDGFYLDQLLPGHLYGGHFFVRKPGNLKRKCCRGARKRPRGKLGYRGVKQRPRGSKAAKIPEPEKGGRVWPDSFDITRRVVPPRHDSNCHNNSQVPRDVLPHGDTILQMPVEPASHSMDSLSSFNSSQYQTPNTSPLSNTASSLGNQGGSSGREPPAPSQVENSETPGTLSKKFHGVLTLCSQGGLAVLNFVSLNKNPSSLYSKILLYIAIVSNILGFVIGFVGVFLYDRRRPGTAARVMVKIGYAMFAMGFIALMCMPLAT